MHPDGRLEYIGYETFDGVLDYPVSAHPVRDGNDLLFHSYTVDEEVSLLHHIMHLLNDAILRCMFHLSHTFSSRLQFVFEY
jgi:carotenoid cleavage dioxygenase-like enzyme